MRRRQGFTLVELLVALALIVFIMAILSQAFATATKTFRDLKSAGDLAERLRMVTARLHRDLAANHFNQGARLSDPKFWQNSPNGTSGAPGPPSLGGFFCIYQGLMPGQALDYVTEGNQVTGVPSTRTTSHGMHFTVQLGGTDLGDIFSTTAAANTWAPRLDSSQFTDLPDARFMNPTIPSASNGTGPVPNNLPSMYNYTWAEVAYWLQASINPSTGVQDDANGTPLFNLFVRRRLAVQDNTHIQQFPAQPTQAPPAGWVNGPDDYPEVSCEYDPPGQTTMYFNSPVDLSVPQRRFSYPKNLPALPTDSIMPQDPVTGGPAYQTFTQAAALDPNLPAQLQNADLLLTDVISFEIRMLFSDPTFSSSVTSTQAYIPNPAQPFMTLWDLQQAAPTAYTKGGQVPAGVMVFDTWSQIATDPTFGDYSQWNTQGNTNTNIPLWNYNNNVNNGPIILAIQVTIRIWDRKSQLTRQVSLVQAM
jgi:prepilin-type N-terminal cleavage/methylation domain-containing protein